MNRSAYTLVELMTATVLSLILLLGTIEMFRSVAGTMQDTRATLNMSAHLEHTAALLRNDLALIPKSLAEKPFKINANINTSAEYEVDDTDGYLEIIEGNPAANPYKPDDATIGDVDDMIAFTTLPSPIPFRGIIGGQVAERNQAEVIWFLRGTSLYRRIRLIDDQHVTDDGIYSPSELADRNKRYGHYGAFPHTIYNSDVSGKTRIDGNYWLRFPTLEETLHAGWNPGPAWTSSYHTLPTVPVDLWETRYPGSGLDPKSGSLTSFVSTPRNPRAGEDVVLTNVISFDIKVCNEDNPSFEDLIHKDANTPALDNVFDSWCTTGTNYADKVPPYTDKLTGIQIVIRCFDPQSRNIKQVTIVHSFID
jgi:hypothetical protein